MATYVMFGSYTNEAMKGVSKERTDQATAFIEKVGGKVQSAYALLGKTDLLVIVDFPGTAEAMKASMALAKMTGISFATSPAVSIEELDAMIGEL